MIKSTRWFYLVFFLFVCLLAVFFVPSPDDWGWATGDGLALFQNKFADYNGRYLGNLCAFALLRAPLLLPFVKALVLTGILYMIQKLSGSRDPRFLRLSALLLILPCPLFIHDVVWTAAFANYEIPVCFLLCCAYLAFCARVPKGGWAVLFYSLLATLGFASQLFMEHYTLFALALSAFAVLYARRREGHFTPRTVLWFCSAIGGAALMFSNGAYRQILRGEQRYQRLEWNPLATLWMIVSNLLIACLPMLIVIAVLLILLRKRNPKAFAALPRHGEAWFYMALLAVLHAPLAVVYPVGVRCFSLAAVILLLLAQKLFAAVAGAQNPVDGQRPGRRTLSVALALVMVFDLAGYATVFAANRRKVAEVRAQVARGEKVIVLRHTPMRFLVYALDAEPKSKNILRAFRNYYDLPDDIQLEYE